MRYPNTLVSKADLKSWKHRLFLVKMGLEDGKSRDWYEEKRILAEILSELKIYTIEEETDAVPAAEPRGTAASEPRRAVPITVPVTEKASRVGIFSTTSGHGGSGG